MTTTTVNVAQQIAANATTLATALADHTHLPMGSLTVYGGDASISVPSVYSRHFEEIREVAQWAAEFDKPVIISLSHIGNGRVQTDFVLADIPVDVHSTLATAQAYELGRLLQRPLSRDVSITIGASELLAALSAAVA